MCAPPIANSGDSLPFIVDVRFIPSGYTGDYLWTKNVSDKTGVACGGRATPTAAGNCHAATYNPPPSGGMGWAGVSWQYPINNWGTSPGYLIPPGATRVAFYAKGKVGGETVTFRIGGITASLTTPCGDAITNNSTAVTLMASWAPYMIPLNGQTYSSGQIIGFEWDVAAPPTDAGAPRAPIQFFVDDIKWQ